MGLPNESLIIITAMEFSTINFLIITRIGNLIKFSTRQ